MMASGSLALLLLIGLQISDLTEADGFQLDYASDQNGDLCKDCTQIFELVADLLSSQELQKKLVDSVEGLCEHLPGPKTTVKICKQEVEKMLPVAIHFITGVIKPAEMCKALGLCHSCDQQKKILSYFVNEALEAIAAKEDGPDSPQRNMCSLCLFLMKTLEDLLPKQRTEDAVIHLLEDVCHILPASLQPQCTQIIDKFSKIIIDAILGYATPRSICQLLHLCKSQGPAPLGPSPELSLHNAFDPCTVESYRCRDVNTALRCGTLFYCQRFAWKPVNAI